jgi:hypothetical protein
VQVLENPVPLHVVHVSICGLWCPWGPGTNPQDTEECQVLMAHTCNPSYSGGRDQEGGVSKPAQVSSLRDPISKKKNHKKGLVE